ncbi:UDP-glucose dehydrogenase family protein [Kitasatospora sp. NPDC004289]
MKLTVIGCGHLGATHAAAMAELGHQVLGLDLDPDKVAALNSGRAPFHEPGLDELLARHTASGRLRFTTDRDEAAAFAELHFLGVGTPLGPDGAYDLAALRAAVRGLAARLTGPAVVVGKSTVPVGTAAELLALLQDVPHHVELCWNPEFLRESRAVQDTLRPDRLVLGFADRSGGTGQGRRAEALVREAYEAVIAAGTPVVVTDLATAELAKSAANAFLATKISFVNAMAEVCEAAGADVEVLTEALGYDVRIGRRGMRAGLGFGGGCLPKDLLGFGHRAAELGADSAVSLLREVGAVNARRRERTVALARELLDGTLADRRITVWGAAFKPGTDDIRDSPALAVADALHRAGATVTVSDPRALDNARKALPHLGYLDDPTEALTGADLLLHLTEWPDYTHLDPAALAPLLAAPRVLDARHTLDPATWRTAGWTYRALGRP